MLAPLGAQEEVREPQAVVDAFFALASKGASDRAFDAARSDVVELGAAGHPLLMVGLKMSDAAVALAACEALTDMKVLVDAASLTALFDRGEKSLQRAALTHAIHTRASDHLNLIVRSARLKDVDLRRLTFEALVDV